MTLIRTDRLTLRGFARGMLDDLHAIMSDWEVVRRSGTWPWPPDRAFGARRCRPLVRSSGIAGLVYREEITIGWAALRDGDLGYCLARAHWGQGYANEIAGAVVRHGFATFDWPQITADVYADNPASARVLERLGFVEGPPGMGGSASHGGKWPNRTFALPSEPAEIP